MHTDTARTDEAPPDPTAGPTAHAARAAAYGAAAAAFMFPTDDRIAALTADDASTGLREAAARLGLRSEAERLIEAFAAADRADLEATYNDLFGVPGDGGTYRVVPYEAAHTVAGDLGETQRRIATVVGLIEALGLEPADGFDERDDHLAVELEAMQVLAGRRAVAEHDGDSTAADRVADAEATVLREHLSGFVPSLAADVEDATDDPAYAAAAAFVRRLVAVDHRARSADPPTDGHDPGPDPDRADADGGDPA